MDGMLLQYQGISIHSADHNDITPLGFAVVLLMSDGITELIDHTLV